MGSLFHHEKHHTHSTGPHHHANTSHDVNLAFALATSLNFIFTIVQAIYAILANSMSLLADAGHNLGDVLGLTMAWGANWLLNKDASAKYSYGFKKTTILAALANALLLVIGSALIAYESVIKLFHPVPINERMVVVIALIGIIINSGTALLFMKGKQHDLNVKGAFLHLMGDAVISAGVVITAILIFFTQWYWADPILSLLIVVAILVGTWGLLRDSVNLMLAAVPNHVDQNAVRNYLANIHGVQSIHDLHIWSLSTQEIALTAHFIMPNNTLTDHQHEEINQVLRDQFHIHHATIQVENGHLEDPCGRAESC